jgi:protoheme IX farnesyltransferase
VGALPGAAPPLIGWTGATGSIEVPGLLLFGLVFVWQVPHVLAITLDRQHEYAQAGLKALPIVAGEARARVELFRWALALLATSLALAGAQKGPIYPVAAMLLGAGILGLAVACLLERSERRWPRRFFMATCFYLPALLASLVFERCLA